MVKKNNSVHLEGVLEGFQFPVSKDGVFCARASVVTLHPRSGVDGVGKPSEVYEKLHHEVRIIGDEKNFALLSSIHDDFLACKNENGSLLPCRVDGFLLSNGEESFVVCQAKSFSRNDMIKTNGNNRVNITGEVVSTSYTNETAQIRFKTDEGVLDSFVSRRVSQDIWDMVADGKLNKGDVVSMSGPLLSNVMSDGEKRIRTCMVSPQILQKQKVNRLSSKKGSVTL